MDPFDPIFEHRIPGWQAKRIKQIVTIKVTDGPHTTPEFHSEGIPFVSAEAIRNNSIDFSRIRGFITKEQDQEFARKCKPQKGDLFIIKSGATTGNIAIVETDMDFNIWSPLALIRCNTRLASNCFIFYQLQSFHFRKQIELNWSFGTQENIGMGVIENLRVLIPPLPEQRRIAAFLDESCKAIDGAITAKEKQIEALGKRLEAAVESLILGKTVQGSRERVDKEWILSIPSHWQVVAIKRVLKRMDYGISESTQDEGKYPVLKMGHIANGEIKLEKLDYVESVDDALLLEEGDILYNRTNSADQVGKAAIVRFGKSEGITFASYLVRLRTNHRIRPDYLNLVLNSQGFLGFARKLAIPSVQQSNLNSTRYGRLSIPLPPVKEQVAIVASASQEKQTVRNLIGIITTQIAALRHYRKSLIHECVTGQRRV